MLRILLLFVFSSFFIVLNAQIVDQIRDASDANTASRSENNEGNSDSDDDDYGYDNDGGGDGSSCNGCGILVDGILGIFFSDEAEEETEEETEEEYYVTPEDPFEEGRIPETDGPRYEEEVVLDETPMENPAKEKRSWGLYGELELRTALGSGFLMALPEARLGYWIFSTNLRYNTLVEPGVNFISSYRTVDWQILQLQAITSRNFNLRFGFGLLNERYSGNTFPEFAMEARGLFLKGRLGTPLDIRYAWDAQTENPVRSEFGVGGEYRVWELFHTDVYASGGYLYQQYYGTVDLNAFQVGLRFVFY